MSVSLVTFTGTAAPMDHDDEPKPLEDLVEPGSTLMVGTENGSGALEFRPLTASAVTADRIDILLDTSAPWTQHLRDGAPTTVTMGDTRHNTWLTLEGRVSTTTDDKVIDELWNPFADAYFDEGRDTPGITVLRIEADAGTYWSTPSGRVGSLISMVKAKLGDPADSGESGPVAL